MKKERKNVYNFNVFARWVLVDIFTRSLMSIAIYSLIYFSNVGENADNENMACNYGT